jgi:hypothetical protein
MQIRQLTDRLRPRLQVGQSMPEVLTAAEDTLAELVTRPFFMTYFLTAACPDRLWAIQREAGPDGGAAFSIVGPSVGFGPASSPSPAAGRRPLAKDEAFRFADAHARGCTVSVDAGQLVFTVGNDGKVASIAPPQQR